MSAEASAAAGPAAGNKLLLIGANWCPHTKHQKELMDNAHMQYNYLEESKMPTPPSLAPGYPTFVCKSGSNLDGKLHSGEMSVDALKSWCPE